MEQIPLFADAPSDDPTLRCLFGEPWMGDHPLCEAEADRIIAEFRAEQDDAQATA